MKKLLYISLAAAAILNASEATVDPIEVKSTKLSDVSGEEVKSADLAEALSRQLPSITLIRRSGIANDILLRGQKRDNINILVDGSKTCGACPNRMDPPTSHILTNNIDSVKIVEGPYDVENFGTLSGGVEIMTKEPTADAQGEVNLNFGSWGYHKVAGTVSGGNDRVQLLISASSEESDQYEDGNGDTLAAQAAKKAPTGNQYKSIYSDMEAYEKKSFMAKASINVTDDQQLKLSYTNNQSDNVMYPNTPMDALWDDSEIMNAEYMVKNMSDYSKAFTIQAYKSEVDHPMSTYYRNASGPNSIYEVISHLTTDVRGLKIKNTTAVNESTDLTIGLDASNRNWDGEYSGTTPASVVLDGRPAINDADTENRALFVEAVQTLGKAEVKIGARYDMTDITSLGTTRTNEYDTLSAFIFTTYNSSDTTKIFGGFGKSNRVPDARELYFQANSGAYVGTDGLQETTNYEIDLGAEHKYENATAKIKTFYSKLKDYIYYNNDKPTDGKFENIDATIYGLEVTGTYYPTDTLELDIGVAYQRGQKDTLTTAQTDKDLADIPPLKVTAGASYYYGGENYARLEMVASDRWDTIDSENGEQEIPGYGIFNAKISQDVNDQFNLTFGIDNLFDKTYAVSNTYYDLTLVSVGGTTMLLNEPGRYVYLNATYRF